MTETVLIIDLKFGAPVTLNLNELIRKAEKEKKSTPKITLLSSRSSH